jgi:hypothetical protein
MISSSRFSYFSNSFEIEDFYPIAIRILNECYPFHARLTDLSQVNINYKINDAPMAINSFVAP